MSVPTSLRTGPVAEGGSTPRTRRPAHWPLTLLVVGFPLWWILGVSELLAMAMALVMAGQLRRMSSISLPRGFGFWLLFLVWLVASVFTLWADAPGAVPGGDASRLLVYGYRLAWYATCTVILLWSANVSERELPWRRVTQLLGYMFVVTALGGLLGVLKPDLELRSLVEILLPGSLSSNTFVNSIIHPNVAEVQTVLGHPEARPTAPFAYANSWGSNLSIYLPFFLVAWFRGRPSWQRYLAPAVLVVSAVPAVYSLNRGLWLSLGVGAVFLVARQLFRGRVAVLMGTLALLGVVTLAFLSSPLSQMVEGRLDNQHSNDRRSQLLVETVKSTAQGSPVVGFGSTRDVQGSFASIAGAATPDCPACGVPPLGTQGHLWLVTFSQGFLGAVFFLGLFVVSLTRTIRCRTPVESICTCLLLFFAIQILIYDILGMPLLTLMLAIGLASREQRERSAASAADRSQGPRPTLDMLRRRIHSAVPTVAAFALAGAMLGGYLAAQTPQLYVARVSILLAPSPIYLLTGSETADRGITETEEPGSITVDTEAALVFSNRTMQGLKGEGLDIDATRMRQHVRVTAAPNTRVLNIGVRSQTSSSAESKAPALADAYLDVRRDYLDNRRSQVLNALRERRLGLDAVYGTGDMPVRNADDEPADKRQREREAIDAAIRNIVLTSTSPGEVIRVERPEPVDKQYSVKATSGGLIGVVLGALMTARLRHFRLRQRILGFRGNK